MVNFELVLPKMGESIIEATITKWFKQVGDSVSEDESIVEVATDKVDSEIPSPIKGKILEIRFNEGSLVPIGAVIAILEINLEENKQIVHDSNQIQGISNNPIHETVKLERIITEHNTTSNNININQRFISPLIRAMAKENAIDIKDLQFIKGSGANNRLTKADFIKYISEAKNNNFEKSIKIDEESLEDQIIVMDRMRRLISEHMIASKRISAHVTSFIDADLSRIVAWREANKSNYESIYKQKITYTPFFINSIVEAIKKFPLINSSVNEGTITIKKNINIGIATALSNGNLIVPVLKNANKLDIHTITNSINTLADRARANKLSPDDIHGGTFTFTNLGNFGSLTGTPIINQPQVAILAAGLIKKRVVVIENNDGDSIGIRHMCILSLSYDHRIVDGSLGGLFLRQVAQNLENFPLDGII